MDIQADNVEITINNIVELCKQTFKITKEQIQIINDHIMQADSLKVTRMLILRYYNEDVTRYGLNHHQALKDISLELGRTTDYISSVLREEHGKGVLSDTKRAKDEP